MDEADKVRAPLKKAIEGLKWFEHNWGSKVAKDYLREVRALIEEEGHQ